MNQEEILRKSLPLEYVSLMEETAEAYADCGIMHNKQLNFNDVVNRRNLDWRAKENCPPKIAKLILEYAVPGYNNFDPSLLDLFPDDCMVTIAREGSVCLYVVQGEKPLPERDVVHADEYNVYDYDRHRIHPEWTEGGRVSAEAGEIKAYAGETRYWWD